MSVLAVDGLTTEFATRLGRLRAVDNVSFSVDAGQTLAIVGESGSGKSVTALSLMRLVAPSGGTVLFEGRDLLELTESEMQRIRGNRVSMIFQEPLTSLNPLMRIGAQIEESIRLHTELSAAAARRRAIELLDLVRIADPHHRIDEYPHRLSGGMRQRVMIAMALACEPALLIADEPTTALDVTVQSQILELMASLQRQMGMALILITHDLGVVAEVADRVVVMYAGRKVEEGCVDSVLSDPAHPYTQGLLASLPQPRAAGGSRRLYEIAGSVPSLHDLPVGCAFSNRCPLVLDVCHRLRPELAALGAGRVAACHVAARAREQA